MRTGELDCIHGVGHSAGVHGCDGCCIPLVQQAQAEAWQKGFTHGSNSPISGQTTDNPYRIIISPNDYNQLRTALDQE